MDESPPEQHHLCTLRVWQGQQRCRGKHFFRCMMFLMVVWVEIKVKRLTCKSDTTIRKNISVRGSFIFSTYVEFSEKLTFTPPQKRRPTRAEFFEILAVGVGPVHILIFQFLKYKDRDQRRLPKFRLRFELTNIVQSSVIQM